MLKRNSKAFAIVLAFVFCMSFMAPAFIVPDIACAGVNYGALSTPVVSTNVAGQSLGIIQIDIDNCAAIKPGDVLTLSFDSEINLVGGPAPAPPTVVGIAATKTAGVAQEVVVPAFIGSTPNALAAGAPAYGFNAVVTSTKTTLDITFTAAGTPNAGRLLIYFQNVTVGSIDKEVTCTILGPASGAFPQYSLVVAKVDDNGGTMTTVKSVKTYGANGGLTDTIIISETIPGRLPAGDVIRLKLPPGFSWAGGAGTWNWGWQAAGAFAPTVNASDNRILDITVPFATNSALGSGQVRFSGMIAVDDAVAKEGDVIASVYDTANKVTEQDATVMSYANYGAKVVEKEVKDLIAGKSEQKIGKFSIQEGIAGSLLANRSIKLTLPNGAEWWNGYRDEIGIGAKGAGFTTNLIPDPIIKKGGLNFKDADAFNAGTQAFRVAGDGSGATDQGRTIKLSLANISTSKGEISFENLKVDVAADFSGDLKVTVSSDAGISGEVLVAKVKPSVEIAAENVKNVRIGEQDQALGDLTITETKKENLSLNSNKIYTNGIFGPVFGTPNRGNTIDLVLPPGATWAAGYPKVEIVEGNIDLDVNGMSKNFNAVTGVHSICIPVKSESTKASKIKITGLKATVNRTVPEGDFKVAVDGWAVDEVGGINLPFPQFEGLKTVVAKCITPAPNEGTPGSAAGEFKIDSNIYKVNGVSKVMDAAPYVKNGRTYVPVKYLGLALGVAEKDIVWDAATQKATLTLGSNKVELTIGSTSYTVNGEAKTMDVAPEITSDRTMLPAKYVAEGLGFQVGWDAATRTVLVSR